ncbi:hypothetical protein K435DRAFT_571976, partial [Dendrothele bispora CBS 962.96]
YNTGLFILDINRAPWGCAIWPAYDSQNISNCDGTIPPNAGCGIQERSRASYREDFNLQGGGVFSMRWDENRIAV